MLINPATLTSQAGLIALLVGVTVLGKVTIVAAVVLALGMPARVGVMAGLSLAQIGEFSFVLARIGVDGGAIPQALFDLTLATALVTIVVTPSLLRAAPALLAVLQRLPVVGGRFADPVEGDAAAEGLAGHAVIAGFGRVGRELADALEARGLRHLVIEYNPVVVGHLRKRGIPVVYGDAGNPAVLEHARVQQAKVLALLMPDAVTAEVAARHARALNPNLDIVARASSVSDLERLRRAGATEVVQPEFEAGVEVIRHMLRVYGIGSQELTDLAVERRALFYRRGTAGEAG